MADASSVRFCQYGDDLFFGLSPRTVVFLLKLTAERFLFCGFSSLVMYGKTYLLRAAVGIYSISIYLFIFILIQSGAYRTLKSPVRTLLERYAPSKSFIAACAHIATLWNMVLLMRNVHCEITRQYGQMRFV